MGVDQENMVIFWELTMKRGVFMGVGVDQETLFFLLDCSSKTADFSGTSPT
jgi:hypothetical protein